MRSLLAPSSRPDPPLSGACPSNSALASPRIRFYYCNIAPPTVKTEQSRKERRWSGVRGPFCITPNVLFGIPRQQQNNAASSLSRTGGARMVFCKSVLRGEAPENKLYSYIIYVWPRRSRTVLRCGAPSRRHGVVFALFLHRRTPGRAYQISIL